MCLKHNKPLKRSSSLYKLNPFQKDGLLKVGGRIEHAPLPYEMKHSVVVPNTHPVASLIIEDIHCKLGHASRKYVLSKLQNKHWVIINEQRLDSTKSPFSYVVADYFDPIFMQRG